MEAYAILAFLFGLPLVIGTVFRVPTAHLFVTILAAEILERYFRTDVELALSPFVANEAVLGYVGVAMLVVPLLLTGIFLKKTATGARMILHVIPLVLSGVVFAAFAAPTLPASVQELLMTVEPGELLLNNASFIVGVTVFLQLLSLWFLTRAKSGKSKKKAD